jgi:hypothetical protein
LIKALEKQGVIEPMILWPDTHGGELCIIFSHHTR